MNLAEAAKTIDYQVFDQVSQDIYSERVRQVAKHGGPEVVTSILEQRERNDFECLSILLEEVGEVARAVNEATWASISPAQIELELIQVAAVASAWVENIRRNGA